MAKQEVIAEHKRESTGEVFDIIRLSNEKGDRYEVNCWDKDGNNRWYRYYGSETEARAEFDKWKTYK